MARVLKTIIVVFIVLIVSMTVLSPLSTGISPHNISVKENSSSRFFSRSGADTFASMQPVNPFSIHQSEPAPMGIVDYGIGPSGQPYEYTTSSFFARAEVFSLIAYNSSSQGFGYNISFQLNVMLTFYNGGSPYVYWVQEGPNINTQNNSISMWVNIFNMSSSTSKMSNSSIYGNGTVINGTYIYNDPYIESGNYATLSYPYSLKYIVNSTVTSNGYPEVKFLYNDGFGWVNFDNVVFKFVNSLTSIPVFQVSGFNYAPNGYMFYDAEWIVGGFGNGEEVQAISSNLTMQLEYWNGHNYQEITNAYNFGSDTAESIDNIVSSSLYYTGNGSLFEFVENGSGSLGQVYTQQDISIINLSSSLSSGYLMVNNSRYDFVGGDVNVTIAPGIYNLELFSSSGIPVAGGNETLTAGEYLPLYVSGLYQVTFLMKGLPSGTPWHLDLSNGESFNSSFSSITIYLNNGSYTFTASSSNIDYYSIGGAFTVSGM
ncbi:MAG: thermopsin, partial [Thermoplasmatales archaeon]